MKKRTFFSLLAATLTVCLALSACTVPQNPTEGESEPTMTTAPTEPSTPKPETPSTTAPQEAKETKVVPLIYPEANLKDLGDYNIKLNSFVARAAGTSDYVGNGHYDGTSVAVSPYFTAKVEGRVLPVYGTLVYVAEGSYGAFHSYASLDAQFGEQGYITVELSVDSSVKVQSAQVFCHDEAELSQDGSTVTLRVYTHGVYTIVLNDCQDYAITLFVRTYQDEAAEIAAYKAERGEDKVIVFERGLHEIDYLHLPKNAVLYLKAGAILLPKHTFDIENDKDASRKSEIGAQSANAIGLNRYPVINAYAGSNIVIAGRGTVDMTQLDWHERRGIVFTLCDNISMDGMIVINPCEWAFITYRCTNVNVTQSAVLGYRTNSDAFAICNTIDATVTDCFARTGDDMFEVKTLGGVDGAVSKNITYSRCQAWGSKARCFGVIAEMEKDISNILFEDGIVIFRDATWDNNRIGSLVVLRECGSGKVDGVTFRNIHIHYDRGRAIQVGVMDRDLTDSLMQNIVFENITYNAKMSSQLRLNIGKGNILSVVLNNVTANGEKITTKNVDDYFYCDQKDLIIVQ